MRAAVSRATALRLALAVLAGLLLTLAGAAPASAQNRFWLVNNTGEVVESAYVSPSRIQSWGTDVLGANVLAPGQQVWIVPNTSDCIIDIKVRFQGGREETRWQVNTCSLTRVVVGGGGATPTGKGVARGGDPSFALVNRSGLVIREVYASLSTDRNWGTDRLGANTLAPGQQLWIPLPAGPTCRVDIRVVYMNGSAQERRSVETCSRSAVAWP
jgi:hypothetical protein